MSAFRNFSSCVSLMFRRPNRMRWTRKLDADCSSNFIIDVGAEGLGGSVGIVVVAVVGVQLENGASLWLLLLLLLWWWWSRAVFLLLGATHSATALLLELEEQDGVF